MQRCHGAVGERNGLRLNVKAAVKVRPGLFNGVREDALLKCGHAAEGDDVAGG